MTINPDELSPGMQELYQFFYSDLKWCGCGDPCLARRFLCKILLLVEQQHRRVCFSFKKERATNRLEELLDDTTHPALYWTYWYMLDAYGLTDHGTGIRFSWLTEKGLHLLKLLYKHRNQLDDF